MADHGDQLSAGGREGRDKITDGSQSAIMGHGDEDPRHDPAWTERATAYEVDVGEQLPPECGKTLGSSVSLDPPGVFNSISLHTHIRVRLHNAALAVRAPRRWLRTEMSQDQIVCSLVLTQLDVELSDSQGVRNEQHAGSRRCTGTPGGASIHVRLVLFIAPCDEERKGALSSYAEAIDVAGAASTRTTDGPFQGDNQLPISQPGKYSAASPVTTLWRQFGKVQSGELLT